MHVILKIGLNTNLSLIGSTSYQNFYNVPIKNNGTLTLVGSLTLSVGTWIIIRSVKANVGSVETKITISDTNSINFNSNQSFGQYSVVTSVTSIDKLTKETNIDIYATHNNDSIIEMDGRILAIRIK